MSRSRGMAGGAVARRSVIRERVIPLAWLLVAMLIFGAAVGLSSPRAHAYAAGLTLRVEVAWNGGDCWARTGTAPADDNARILSPFVVLGCHDSAVETRRVAPGDWYGADPAIGNAYSVSCTVTNTATGRIVLIDYARNGDGHNATCLGRA